MKGERFEATPEFKNFKEVMRGVLSVPKERLDELVKSSKQNLPRVDGKLAKRRTGKKTVRARAQ
jgi:hypothetical protein